MKKQLLLLFLLSFSISINSQEKEANASGPVIVPEAFASGFNNVIDIQNAGDDRLFIVEQEGRIKIVSTDGTTNEIDFLNITDQTDYNGEKGLLGLAFHPDYSTNGFFYIHYSDTNGDTQISRFTVSSDSNIADPSSEFEILSFNQPFSNHNGGHLTFGPDGYLWIGTGDGGDSGDPQNNSQNLNSLLGKMLRIDVDNITNENNYTIPEDNPYAGDANSRNEIWAYGLKSPKKYSFDSETNELWIVDSGQGTKDEINRVSSTISNINYGWKCYEGNSVFDPNGCPPENTITFPIYELTSEINCSAIGGYVYHGIEYEDIEGSFIYADNCSHIIASINQPNSIYITSLEYPENWSWTTFGEDNQKNLYIASANGDISIITVQWLIGFEEFTANNFTITPNPASQMVRLSVTDDELTSIEVYDLKGSVVYTEENMNVSEKTINVSSFKNGLYIVNATTVNGGNISKKLIIE